MLLLEFVTSFVGLFLAKKSRKNKISRGTKIQKIVRFHRFFKEMRSFEN